MSPSTYLSVDIDYWLMIPDPQHILTGVAFLEELFTLIMERGISIRVVTHHHQLLPHIEENPVDQLMNIDYHSDIAEIDQEHPEIAPELSEGTWGNHVSWRDRSRFRWFYPHWVCFAGRGRCEAVVGPFSAKRFGWKRVSAHKNRLPVLHKLNLARVGVALSPAWRYVWDQAPLSIAPEVYAAEARLLSVTQRIDRLKRLETDNVRPYTLV